MKEIIADIKGENFSRREVAIYGFIAPLVLVAACVVAELLNR